MREYYFARVLLRVLILDLEGILHIMTIATRAGIVALLVLSASVDINLTPADASVHDSAASAQPQSEASSEMDAPESLAAAQLATDYNVPLVDAKERMRRQPALVELAETLRVAAGNHWAGAYIDHSDDGTLVAMTTEPDGLEGAVAGTPGVAIREHL